MLTQSLYIDPSFISYCHKKLDPSRFVLAWTVNQDQWMRWCIEQELDGVITDDPKRFCEVKEEWEQGRRGMVDGGGRVRVLGTMADRGMMAWLWVMSRVFLMIIRLRMWRSGVSTDGGVKRR